MLEILPQSKGNILGVRLTGKVSDSDYEEIFLPALQKLINEHGKVRCLYFMDSGFEGWTLGAAWDDAKFGIRHRDDFEKCAIVGGPKWAEWATKLVSHLISAEVKTYSDDQLDEAWHWVLA
jgi:hypothetical protein